MIINADLRVEVSGLSRHADRLNAGFSATRRRSHLTDISAARTGTAVLFMD